MSTATSTDLSNTAVFIEAVNIIILEADFFSNRSVQVWAMQEDRDGITVAVQLNCTSARYLEAIMSDQDTIESVTIDGIEVPVHMRDRNTHFIEATAKVKAEADRIIERNVQELRDEAIRQEWAEYNANAEAEEVELDDISLVFEEVEVGLNQPYTRRDVIRRAIGNLLRY